MPKIEVSETIERPVKEVWAYLSDPGSIPEWFASTQEVEVLTDGGLKRGARVRSVDRFLGRSMEFVSEVSEYDPPHRLGLEIMEGSFDGHQQFELQPEGDTTRVTMRAEGEAGFGGVFGKLLDPVVTAAFRREAQSDLGRLKDLLEIQAAEEAI